MILDVDLHSGIPVYRQLMDQIRFHVASGLLNPGDEIPSTRNLSAKLGVNPMTISKALGQLEAEGILERRAGLPHVVRTRPNAELRATKLEQLEAALRPVATKVRQLGVDAATAIETLRQLLENDQR